MKFLRRPAQKKVRNFRRPLNWIVEIKNPIHIEIIGFNKSMEWKTTSFQHNSWHLRFSRRWRCRCKSYGDLFYRSSWRTASWRQAVGLGRSGRQTTCPRAVRAGPNLRWEGRPGRTPRGLHKTGVSTKQGYPRNRDIHKTGASIKQGPTQNRGFHKTGASIKQGPTQNRGLHKTGVSTKRGFHKTGASTKQGLP
jgi:hypothetical protein